jgi:hypothetical protein
MRPQLDEFVGMKIYLHLRIEILTLSRGLFEVDCKAP